jgi:mannose-6-phosphate isomerase
MIPVLKFHPLFKSVIWGGQRIAQFKNIPSQGDHIGESWELSPMPGFESIVADGPFKGESLSTLVARYPREILGDKVNEKYHGKFPLLIKFIDSNDDLSIQVHPDDEMAQRLYGSYGKTEMWYSLQPKPGAYLYSGFNCPMDAETLRRKIADNTIIDVLGKYYVKPGDVFYLPAGRIHAIGKGNFVVEIQQACDHTYRIYDYDRRDANGHPRALHIDQALAALHFPSAPANPANEVQTVNNNNQAVSEANKAKVNENAASEGKTVGNVNGKADTHKTVGNENGDAVRNVIPAPGQSAVVLSSEYFTTTVIDVISSRHLDLAHLSSFTILIALSGALTLRPAASPDSEPAKSAPITIAQGQTLLIPACIPAVTLTGHGQLLAVNL